MIRFRIIPATITIAALLFGVKLIDVLRGTEALSDNLLIAKVEAQQTASPKEKLPEKPVEAAAKKIENAQAKPEGKSSEEKKDDSKEVEDKDAKNEGEGGEGKDKEKKNPNVMESAGETLNNRYTSVEVELLQNLARRRDELSRWEQNIQIKEEALHATEKRVDDKINQIDAMKREVALLLAQYNEKEDAKIRSLVKIYENMKPADAARIFDEVDMPILLLVVDKMSEKKAAPVLANMDPKKAKQITQQLAEQRRVSSVKLGAPGGLPTMPPPLQPNPAQ